MSSSKCHPQRHQLDLINRALPKPINCRPFVHSGPLCLEKVAGGEITVKVGFIQLSKIFSLFGFHLYTCCFKLSYWLIGVKTQRTIQKQNYRKDVA